MDSKINEEYASNVSSSRRSFNAIFEWNKIDHDTDEGISVVYLVKEKQLVDTNWGQLMKEEDIK